MRVTGKAHRIAVPFALENDFVVVNVLLNGEVPLRFIVDTGAEHTVLLDKIITDQLKIDYRRRFEIRGADVDSLLVAYLATGISMRVGPNLLARDRNVLVLEENYFQFEQVTGTDIHGILGADFLMRFVVEFDWKRRELILHAPNHFKLRRGFREAEADFIRNRPYLHLPVGVRGRSTTERRVLLDTGAGLPLLLHTFADSLELPDSMLMDGTVDLPAQIVPTHIANGLGGRLRGSVGRTKKLLVSDVPISDVVTYFQEIDTAAIAELNNREGIIGTRLLNKFHLIVDYTRRKVYVRPYRRVLREGFSYDRSGLSVTAGGNNLRTFTVGNVLPQSPAARADIRVGDRIWRLNGVSHRFITLGSIVRRLENKAGTRVRIRVERQGRYYDKELILEDII